MTNGHEKVDNRIGKKLTDLLQKKKNNKKKDLILWLRITKCVLASKR